MSFCNRLLALRRLFAASAAAVALTLGNAPTPAPAQDNLPVIRLGTGPDGATTPVLYAIKSGLYKKYGLEVQPTLLGSGAAAAAAVSGGSIDIGKTSTIAVITFIAKGVPFTAIGSLGYYD